ncbi:putative replication initiation protein [Eel River basin pequenovirus]|nr:putative replication initiation protein [Eel River basin pequenovirus]
MLARRCRWRLNRCERILLDLPYTTTTTRSWRFKICKREYESYGSSKEHMMRLFGEQVKGVGYQSRLEKSFLKRLKVMNTSRRISEIKTRIVLEILEKNKRNWYPVMNNLTVSDHNMTEAFDLDGENHRVFEKYMFSFKRKVKDAVTEQDPTFDEGDDYHTYFAVVERGGKTNRLHYHVLHFCRKLPKGCSDPNYGRDVPNYRVINRLRSCWSHGFSAPIAVRFNGMDVYGRDGWRWPVERTANGFVAVDASTPEQLASYLAKYVTKAYGKEQFKWRTRMSRDFGTNLIALALSQMTNPLLKLLMRVQEPEWLKIRDKQIPKLIVQKLSTRLYLHRMQSSSPSLNRQNSLRSLQSIQPQSSIVQQLRSLTRMKPITSSQSTGHSLTQNMNATDIFRIRQEFENVLDEFGIGEDIAMRGSSRIA